MIPRPEESKNGLYEVYYNTNGKKFLVLEGLEAGDVYEPPYLQKVIHEHLGLAELFYWTLFIAAAVYMFGLYVVLPTLRKYNIF